MPTEKDNLMKSYAIVSALLIAAPAFAQSETTYNGFFIGAQTGWQQDQAKVPSDSINVDVSTDGWMYGAQAGYDWRLDRFVIGLEAMISGSSGSSEELDTAGNSYKLNAGTTWGFSTRAGYLVSDPVLLYARLGYSWASYNYVFNQSIKESYNQDGITVGFGGEYQMSPSFSLRLEWNYADFGSNTFQRPPVPPQVFLPTDLKFERMGVSLGVNYRF